MNQITLCGTIVKDTSFIMNEKGEPEARNRLAVDRCYDGHDDKSCDYVTLIAYGREAHILRTCKQGVDYGITGHLRPGTYERNGVTHYCTDVLVTTVTFVRGKKA